MYPKLQKLHAYLDSLQSKVDLGVLGKLLAELEICPGDVKDSCLFSDETYKRNKLACSDWYEMLILCWRPGQESKVHDHQGSSCGFKVLKGTTTEVRYVPVAPASDIVRPVGMQLYHVDDLVLAEDTEIHRVSNESETEELITLHIYSPPLCMNTYTVDSSEIIRDNRGNVELPGQTNR